MGNHFFQCPLYHLSEAFFRFFINLMGSDGFAVRPFGDDAADGSGFQSQHEIGRASCRERVFRAV